MFKFPIISLTDPLTFLQVSVNDEGRDMWKVYLDMKDYAAALANCRNAFQRDEVYLAQVTWFGFSRSK